MPKPMQGLTELLQVFTEQELEILPATGQAVDDILAPDEDERFDTVFRRDERHIQLIWEKPNRNLYVRVSPLPRHEEHVFRYFQDGSQRVHFLGTVLEGDRATPVQIGQFGVAVLKRMDDGQMRCAQLNHRWALIVNLQVLSEPVQKELRDRAEAFGWEIADISEPDYITRHLSPEMDMRQRGIGKAHYLMQRLELEVARSLERDDEGWLLMDGTFHLTEFVQKPPERALCIAKSFSKEPQFSLRTKDRGRVREGIMRLLANLEHEHRTAVFSMMDGQVLFWYVRIREQRHLDYPLMGVIKVEMPNPSMEPINSELVDRLSRALVAERTVTPYGRDRRWHAHLYSIWLAERYVQNAFLPREVVRSMVKWDIRR